MIILRRGRGPYYLVTSVTAATLTTAELLSKILPIVKESVYRVHEPKCISILTEDGHRVEELVIDFVLDESSDFAGEGKRTLDFAAARRRRRFTETKRPPGDVLRELLAALQAIGSDVRIFEYEYNDRWDSPEIEALSSRVRDVAVDSIKDGADAVLGIVRRRFFAGELDRVAIENMLELLEAGSRWTATVGAEILGLLVEHLYDYEKDGGEAFGGLGSFSWSLPGPEGPAAVRADVVYLKELIRAIVQKGWLAKLSCLADVGHLCRSKVDSDSFGSNAAGEYRGAILKQDTRERVLAYAADPNVEFDEFQDLLALRPPEGYKVLRRLSKSSGFKVVYEARNREGKEIALKRYLEEDRIRHLLAELGLGKEEMISRDIATHFMGNIRHTHILPCDSIKNGDDELFIVEPFVTTIGRVDRERPAEMVRAVREISEALGYLHENGLIHSDIKPENIGIQNGKAVLLDFGAATYDAVLRPVRKNPGSIRTRAPELFSETAVPTRASDVWAMGATMMALASGGEYPFLDSKEAGSLPPREHAGRAQLERTVREQIEQYRKEPWQFEDWIKRAIPRSFQQIERPVIVACALNPDDRPSAEELVRLLNTAGGRV